jgi:hypothetical protein
MKIPPLNKLLKLLRDAGVTEADVSATSVRVVFGAARQEAKRMADTAPADERPDDIALATGMIPAPEPRWEEEPQ